MYSNLAELSQPAFRRISSCMQMLLFLSALLSAWVLIYRQCACLREPLKSSGFGVLSFMN